MGYPEDRNDKRMNIEKKKASDMNRPSVII